MSYEIYKLIHYIGIFLVLMSLSGIAAHILGGGTKADFTRRKLFASLHGIGLFVSLLGGFGMLAKLQIHWPFPTWIAVKLLIWLALGGMPVLFYRQSQKALIWFTTSILLAVSAAALAIFKL